MENKMKFLRMNICTCAYFLMCCPLLPLLSNAQGFSCAAISSYTATSMEYMDFRCRSLVRDYNGNLITVGQTGSDYYISKSGNNCAIKWKVAYSATSTSGETASDVAVDINNNIYVTGRCSGPNMSDILTIKLSPSGTVLWSDLFDYNQNTDYGTAITTDNMTNRVVVAGWSIGAGGIVVRKLNTATGAAVWTQTWVSPNLDYEISNANGIATDASANIYVCGESAYHTSDNVMYSRAVLLKFSSSGNLLWANEYFHPITSCTGTYTWFNYYNTVKVDFSGAIYCSGSSATGCNNQDVLLNKFSPGGNLTWTATYDRAPVHYRDLANDIAFGVDGNINLTGSSASVAGGTGAPDIGVYQFDNAGNFNWASFYSGSAISSADEGLSIVVDACSEAIYVGGNIQVQGPPVNTDYAVLAYSPGGTLQWASTYGQVPGGGEDANEIVLGSGQSPSLHIAGITTDASGNTSLGTIKFGLPVVGCARAAGEFENELSQFEFFPNPSHGRLTIHAPDDFADFGQCILTISSMDGKEVFTSAVSERQQEINLSLPGGLYIARIETSNAMKVFKLMILD